MILSDVTKRVILVKGADEVERIKTINKDFRIFECRKMRKDLCEITLIERVGSYYKNRR